jgi:hypothetical protein
MRAKRKCKGCGKQFEPSRRNQKYHCEACRKNRYERTRAGRERKVKYSLSLLGTIAQAKYDSSDGGQHRKLMYRISHPKLTRRDGYYSPAIMPTNRLQAEEILKNPKKSPAAVKAAAKKLLKPIYAHRDKCDATSKKKYKMIREETFRIAMEKDIRPEEAFELLKQQWTERGIQPRYWFRWERYCTPDEWEELQIHKLEMDVQALATEKNIPLEEATAQFKKEIWDKAMKGVMFRASVQGRINPGGQYTIEQFNSCMLDVANRFDFQWAGGQPVWIGSKNQQPKVTYGFRRLGHPPDDAPSLPSTTD